MISCTVENVFWNKCGTFISGISIEILVILVSFLYRKQKPNSDCLVTDFSKLHFLLTIKIPLVHTSTVLKIIFTGAKFFKIKQLVNYHGNCCCSVYKAQIKNYKTLCSSASAWRSDTHFHLGLDPWPNDIGLSSKLATQALVGMLAG